MITIIAQCPIRGREMGSELRLEIPREDHQFDMM